MITINKTSISNIVDSFLAKILFDDLEALELSLLSAKEEDKLELKKLVFFKKKRIHGLRKESPLFDGLAAGHYKRRELKKLAPKIQELTDRVTALEMLEK